MGSILASLIQPVYPLEIYKNQILIIKITSGDSGQANTSQDMRYDIGVLLNGLKIDWKTTWNIEIPYNSLYPSIRADKNGKVLLVYAKESTKIQASELMYVTGKITSEYKIVWEKAAYCYDLGLFPSLAYRPGKGFLELHADKDSQLSMRFSNS